MQTSAATVGLQTVARAKAIDYTREPSKAGANATRPLQGALP